MSNELEDDDVVASAIALAAALGASGHPQAESEASNLRNALAANAASAEDRLIDDAEDWVRKNAHPEQAGAVLDLINYARELKGRQATGVDSSEWLYAWQVLQAGVWNLIGMQLPNGQTIPMVTMRSNVAAEMQNYARAHGEINRLPVRLIAFTPGAILQQFTP